MSDTEPQVRTPIDGGSRPAGTGALAQLQTSRGTTTIDDAVVSKIAALGAKEVDGVSGMGGSLSGAISSVVGRIRGAEHRTSGVGVEVGSRQAAIDLSLKIRYPAPVHQVADAVRQNVIDRIESLTGLEVVEVNIAVIDLEFETDDESAPSPSRVE
ncbi:Asp23/Gls24 family envelope stress response protein [soil metagenome]